MAELQKREKIEKQQKSVIKRLSFPKIEDVSNFNWRKHNKGENTKKLGMYETSQGRMRFTRENYREPTNS